MMTCGSRRLLCRRLFPISSQPISYGILFAEFTHTTPLVSNASCYSAMIDIIEPHYVTANNSKLFSRHVKQCPPGFGIQWKRRKVVQSDRNEIDGGSCNDVGGKEDIDWCLQAVKVDFSNQSLHSAFHLEYSRIVQNRPSPLCNAQIRLCQTKKLKIVDHGCIR